MSDGLNFRVAARVGQRFYYGWVIVGVLLTSNLIALSSNSTFGLFVTPLEREFGWSRSQIAFAPTLGTLLGALLAPLIGFAVDRLGVRPLMVVAGLVGAIIYFLLGRLDALWQFYILFALLFAVMVPGVGQMASNVSITRWFVRRRGRAMGMVMMGASAGGMIFVPVQSFLIDGFGWRVAYSVMAVFPLLLTSLPVFLLLIDNPDHLGMAKHPELQPMPTGAESGPQTSEVVWTFAEAARTRAFWQTLFGVMLGTVVVSGYFVHAVPHMENLGFSRGVAATTWATFFTVGTGAKFLWGFITEKTTVRWALVLLFLGEGLGLFLLLTAQSPRDLFIYAAVTGFCHGPFLQLIAQVWGDYFGRGSIGRIYGAAQPAVVLSGSVGPFLGGYLFDLFGNYSLFLRLLMGMAWFAALVFALNAPPVKRGAALAR